MNFIKTVTETKAISLDELLLALEAIGCPVHDRTDAEWTVWATDGLAPRARRAIDSGPNAESFEFERDKIVVDGKRLSAIHPKAIKNHGPMPESAFLSSYLLSTTTSAPNMQRIDALVRHDKYIVSHSSHGVETDGVFDQKFSTDESIHIYSVDNEMKSDELKSVMRKRVVRNSSKTPWPDVDNPWDEYRGW